ncbi:hypothetical protein [Enterovibrio makurazakiensis]
MAIEAIEAGKDYFIAALLTYATLGYSNWSAFARDAGLAYFDS